MAAKRYGLYLIWLVFALILIVQAEMLADDPADPLPSFPGAQGWGSTTARATAWPPGSSRPGTWSCSGASMPP